MPLYGDDSHLINAQVSTVIRSPYLCIFDARVVAICCSPRPYLSHRRFVRLRLYASIGATTPNLLNAMERLITITPIGHGVDNVLRSSAWTQLIIDHLGYES